jgi:hypothetical protein
VAERKPGRLAKSWGCNLPLTGPHLQRTRGGWVEVRPQAQAPPVARHISLW